MNNTSDNLKQDLITHVCIKYHDHVLCLPRPFRHKHVLKAVESLLEVKLNGEEIYGFLTNSTKFLLPEKAFEVALKGNQLIKVDLDIMYLRSEEIWVAEVPFDTLEYILPHLRIITKSNTVSYINETEIKRINESINKIT